MPVASMPSLLQHALEHGYATGYFECWDQYSLEASIEASERLAAPAIIGFGAAVCSQEWLNRGALGDLAQMARRMAERASVPTAVIFNEGQDLNQVAAALDAGCNAVMLDSSALSFHENCRITRRVFEMASSYGAAVEAELGHLPDASDPGVHGFRTDPEEAARFVEVTGVHALAVSIGNAHLVQTGAVAVDLDHLAAIRDAVQIPLVLHGGSGLPAEALAGAIALGVAKINVGTRLKRLFMDGVRDALPPAGPVSNVHPFVGSREETDYLWRGKRAMSLEIERLIRLYGSAGRAAAA